MGRWMLAALLALGLSGASGAQELRTATLGEERAVLGKRDTFIQALSPFDRQARLESRTPVDEATFLSFLQAQALDWDDRSRALLDPALADLREHLARVKMPAMPDVLLVRTTGQEEGEAPHSRGRAIVLPNRVLSEKTLSRVLAHEYFHVICRLHPELRDRLYDVVNFAPNSNIEFPAELLDHKITNPDAPLIEHAVMVKGDRYTPILFANRPYTGGPMFTYLTVRLLRIGSTELRELDKDYRDRVGGNTDFVIHPEEVLADNFALLVMGGDAPNGKLLDLLRDILERASSRR